MNSDLPADAGSSDESSDRISDLPKEVIHEILHHLPLNEAVRTSLLSTRWRHKWMSMPRIVFANESFTPVPAGSPTEIASKMVNFLNKFLLLHDGTISEFELGYFDLGEFDFSHTDLDHLLFVLSKKRINHFFLDLDFGEIMYEIPSCIFTCHSLKSLDLYSCKIVELPLHYSGFPHLIRLGISYVNLSNETFEDMVANIPLLRTLTVHDCFDLTRFWIRSSPNLVDVRIQGNFQSIQFRYAPKVEILYIHICGSIDNTFERCKLDGVVAGLDALQCVQIYYPFVECLPTGEILRSNFCHLTNVSLFVEFDDSEQVSAILYLCRSSPVLRRLKIEEVCNKQMKGNDFWEGLVTKEDNILHQLQAVKMVSFNGAKNEMGLMSFVLLNAVALKTFSIKWNRRISKKVKLHAQNEVAQFERASTLVEMIF